MKKIRLGSQSSLYPYPATIICVEINGQKNYMQLGFVGIVNANPGMIAMGVGKHHFTTPALMEEGYIFGLALADEDMMIKADYVGIRSGERCDKSEVFDTFEGDNKAILLTDAPINLELKVLKVLDLGGLDYIIISEILQVYAEERVMTGQNPDIQRINPLLFSMYENKYYKIGDFVGRGWRDGLEYEKLRDFVFHIFESYDNLSEISNEYFKTFMDEKSMFRFNGEIYEGFEGFSKWLDGGRNTLILHTLSHKISNFDVKFLEENRFEVRFNAEAQGTKLNGSEFKDKAFETWIIRKEGNSYIIESYIAA